VLHLLIELTLRELDKNGDYDMVAPALSWAFLMSKFLQNRLLLTALCVSLLFSGAFFAHGSTVADYAAGQVAQLTTFNPQMFGQPTFIIHRLYDDSPVDVYVQSSADLKNLDAYTWVSDTNSFTVYRTISLHLIATECTQETYLYLYWQIDTKGHTGREELANGVGYCVEQTIKELEGTSTSLSLPIQI
jgi:hypothetical protein